MLQQFDLETQSPPLPRAVTDAEWYVLYTKPRQEHIAELNLQRQGYRVYFPRCEVIKRRKRLLTGLIEPFFPRYLFINLDKTRDNWAPIRSTRGVCGIVRFEGVPKPVPTPLIDALKSNENPQQLQTLSRQTWSRGEEVEIEQGPFAGYSCIFQESRGIDRVVVLLNIVGKPTRATLLKNDLQAPQPA
ncbi:MAG: transcription/translation regulatory transformer protein RfaH [Gammaproteobacteria bacterium]